MTDPTKIPDEVAVSVLNNWLGNDWREAYPEEKHEDMIEDMCDALAAAGFAELREDAERYREFKLLYREDTWIITDGPFDPDRPLTDKQMDDHFDLLIAARKGE